jgi:hypothetical protein
MAKKSTLSCGLIAGIMLLLLLGSDALAQTTTQSCQGQSFQVQTGVKLVCSAAWQFFGNCDGTDQVYSWAIKGKYPSNSWQIVPWEPFPISIVGFQLVKQSGDPHDFFMIGNHWVPDPMLFMGKDDTQAQIMLPAGYGFPFPATGPSADAYLDLHGSCSGGRIVNFYHRLRAAVGLGPGSGARVSLFMTVYYTPSSVP